MLNSAGKRIQYLHNVIAPNSFRIRMARRLIKESVAKYGKKIGAVYLVGSTASRRAMQDSSINVLFVLDIKDWQQDEAARKEMEDCLKDIQESASELSKPFRAEWTKDTRTGKVTEVPKTNWYFTLSYPVTAETARKAFEAEGETEAEIIYGKQFAKKHGLPLKIRSKKKRARYSMPKMSPQLASGERMVNPRARQRNLGGLFERLRIERERHAKRTRMRMGAR